MEKLALKLDGVTKHYKDFTLVLQNIIKTLL